MKILLISYEIPPECAGIGYSFERFCSALERQGFEFDILVGNHCKKSLIPMILRYWTTPKRYDLIHFWGGLPTLLLPIKTRPYILTVHGSDVPGRNKEYDSFFNKKWIPYSDAFLRAKSHYAVTEGLTKRVQRFYGIPCKTIPNGVSFKNITRHPPINPMMVTVGRLIPLKRTELLIDMMQHLPNGYLTIVGDGPMKLSLEHRAARLGVKPRIHFAGWSNPDEYLRDGYVYVSSADATGVPLAMYEAIEYRLPIVAVECPGMDLINYVGCDSTGQSLAEGVRYCLETYNACLPQPGVKTWDEVANEYIHEYERIVK